MPDFSETLVHNPLSASSTQTLADLIEQINGKLDRGEEVDLEAIVAAYPEHEERLRELMPTMVAMASWGREPAEPNGKPADDTKSALSGVLGDFRIVGELGRGGMGTVFETEQISMSRRVALKVLPFAALANDKALQRFRNEVRAAAALDHPHIVSVYSVGEERGIHYYSMQLIRGQTLAELIYQTRCELLGSQKNSSKADARKSMGNEDPTIDSAQSMQSTVQDEQARLSTVVNSRRDVERYRTAAKLGIEAAKALQHAHDQGVLHRDIKPGNLMLDAEGKLYVTDFGLARIEADAGMTMTGDIVGTLRYMAPEQALAKRVVIDHRADIYSLGTTLYELLALQPAYGETDRSELLKQIAFEEPQPLRKVDRSIPAELETIVQKAMEKAPDDRYQSAQELADDLQAYLDDRPILAKLPTVFQHVAKWSRRHLGVVWTMLCAAVALASIGLIGAGLLAQSRNYAVLAQEEAKLQADNAELNFRIAQQAVDRMLTGVAESAIADAPELRGLRQELFESALDYYDQLLASVVNDSNVLMRRARVKAQLLRYDDALEDFRRAVEVDPSDDLAHAQYASYLTTCQKIALRDFHRAEVHSKKAIEIDPDSPGPWVVLAAVHRHQRMYSKALQAINQAIRLGMSQQDAEIRIKENALSDAIRQPRAFHQAVRKDLGRSVLPEAYVERSEILRAMGENSEAISDVNSAIQLDPSFADAYRLRADYLVELEEHEAALRDYRRAEELDGYNIYVYENRGVLLITLGRRRKAIDDFTRVIALAPERQYPYWYRAKAMIDIRQYDDALADIEKLAELGWKFPFGVLTSKSIADSPKSFHEGLLKIADEAVEQAADAIVHRASLNQYLGRSEAAQADFEAAIRQDLDVWNVLNAVAWRLATTHDEKLRNGKQAVWLATKASELTDYTDATIIDTLAAAHASAGDFEEAVNWSEKSLELLQGDQDRTAFEDHLEQFKNGKPWLEE